MSGGAAAPVRQASTAATLAFPRHFGLLACAALLQVTLLGPKDVVIVPLPLALQGVLHALTLSAALRAPRSLVRRALFILIAGLLACAAFYAASWLDDLLDRLWRLPLLSHAFYARIVALIAAPGALAYAFLVRLFWLPRLSGAAACGIAIACTAVSFLAAMLHLKDDWVIVLWWLTFSTGLWWFCRERAGAREGLSAHRA